MGRERARERKFFLFYFEKGVKGCHFSLFNQKNNFTIVLAFCIDYICITENNF